MKLTFRWYGLGDRIPLDYIRQIPNMYSVVTAVYDVPVGEVWPRESIATLVREAEAHGLKAEVIESVPVHEDIKLGLPTRDKYIANYCENIRRLERWVSSAFATTSCPSLTGQEHNLTSWQKTAQQALYITANNLTAKILWLMI